MLGHPVGLYTLFFAEMWERFSYYGMRALLILYMTKGFLRYGDSDAYAVYGAYCSLVYMTPFFGGMLADRVLGSRRAVAFGGLLMCAGQALLMLPQATAFFAGLALIICGNGFFKPNISTIVGTLYPKGSPKRDGGFTIFYMGINMGAALAPLLCGYIGELYGWQYGFGLASLGMLIGVAIFVAPTVLTQFAVLGGASGRRDWPLHLSPLQLLHDGRLFRHRGGRLAVSRVACSALSPWWSARGSRSAARPRIVASSSTRRVADDRASCLPRSPAGSPTFLPVGFRICSAHRGPAWDHASRQRMDQGAQASPSGPSMCWRWRPRKSVDRPAWPCSHPGCSPCSTCYCRRFAWTRFRGTACTWF